MHHCDATQWAWPMQGVWLPNTEGLLALHDVVLSNEHTVGYGRLRAQDHGTEGEEARGEESVINPTCNGVEDKCVVT